MSNWKEYAEEAQEALEYLPSHTSDALLFAIDMSESVHNQLSTIISTLQSLLTRRINDSDLIGVLLINSSKRRNPMDLPGLCVLYDLDIPSVDRIKALDTLTPASLIDEYAGGESCLSDVFWCANNLFASNIKQKSFKKHLVLVTAPPTADLRAAAVRARDLVDVGCLITIFTFTATDGFAPLMVESGDPSLQPVTHIQVTDDDFASELSRKSNKKNRIFTVPFTLYPGYTLGVVGYSLVMPHKIKTSVLLDAATNMPVETKSLNLCTETSQALLDSEIKYAYEYAGKSIIFTKEEVEQMKFTTEPGLTLLGFKDKSILKWNYNTTHSCLVYPSDSDIKGSCAVFANLVDSMARLGRVAVCSLVSRRNSYSRLVALYPSLDDVYGLMCIYLPFADDKRKVAPFAEIPSVSDGLLDATKQVVKKLVLKNFDPANIPNPVVEVFEDAVAALALGRDLSPKADATLPRVTGMHRRCGETFDLIHSLVAKEVVPEPVAVKKRPRVNVGEGTAKKAKVVDGDVDVKQLAHDGNLGKLTVKQLTDYLKSIGAPKTTGKKDALIQLVLNSLNI